jgi:hypothetical protein
MNTFVKAKRLEIFIIIIVIALFGVTYALTQKATAPVISSTNVSNQNQATADGIVTYQGEDGRSALELLTVFHKVKIKHYSFGDQVIAIDDVEPDGTTAFWEFYVNGKSSPVGAGSYVTKSSDILSWKVSKIDSVTQ